MRIQPDGSILVQGTFEFLDAVHASTPKVYDLTSEESQPDAADGLSSTVLHEQMADEGQTLGERPIPSAGPAEDLQEQARQMLLDLGMNEAIQQVKVLWNPRLKSTAGYAAYPSWRIELNPRLVGFEGQVERTLRHELAHLVAYHRAGRRRIEPHGPEWRKACADLGIPDESAHHRLPLPRSRRERTLAYQCPHCRVLVRRVRHFKRPTACLSCCRAYNGGEYHERFRFVRVQESAVAMSGNS